MTEEKQQRILEQLMAKGNIKIGQLSIGDHNTFNYNAAKEEAGEDKSEKQISRDELGKAILAVQKMFWGNSSYAVIFCAVRDHHKGDDNYTLFENEVNSLSEEIELEYPCPPNTIASTFYNNSYLKLDVGKWEENNVKQRSIQLVKAFDKAVENIRKENKALE